MREIYNRLFKVAGWFSPLAKPAGWFYKSAFDTDTHVINLAATEGADTAAFELATVAVVDLVATEGRDAALFEVATVTVLDLAATEGQDTAAFEITVTNEVVINLNATEGQDTAHFEVNNGQVIPPVIATGPFLGGPIRQPKEAVHLTLRAAEGQDRAQFQITVLAKAKIFPDPAPVPVPLEPVNEIRSLAYIDDPSPKLVPPPVGARMLTRERADWGRGSATVTDWIVYDNDALMALED